ncbi:MAG: hypothetical protein ACRDHK_09010, partial [Actinomycetota bacterium]
VYASMIRRLTTTKDSTFGRDPDFPVIFVVDRIDPGAGDPEDTSDRGEQLSEDEKRLIRDRLSDLPIEFVSDEDEVVIPVEDGGGVERNGVVVTLGPIPEGEQRVEVPASLYAGPLAGTWLTYVLEFQEGEWKVTGITGPVAIS